MKTFLISYQLWGPETSDSYKKLIEKIQEFSSRAKPMKSVRLIKSTLDAWEIRDTLMPLLDPNDMLLVIEVNINHGASYNLSKTVSDWLDRK